MREMSLHEEEICEPQLNYWKATPKNPSVSYSIRNPSLRCGQFYPPQFHPLLSNQLVSFSPSQYSQPTPQHRSHSYPQASDLCYPLTDAGHSQIQNQDSQMTTDSMIQDEVTRAAKTLFSKRNRTLLHWLNPDVSKNQLKIDVDAAWESLPESEKMFYISQVLGKFAPHRTSLMVNPQLEPSKKELIGVTIQTEKIDIDETTNTSNDSRFPSDNIKTKGKASETKVKKFQVKMKHERKSRKRTRYETSTDDESSCDSGLVIDIEPTNELKEIKSKAEMPRIKRKYTKRKQKDKNKQSNEESIDTSCTLSSDVNDIKVELKTDSVDTNTPRVKRKYVKRKLVRKKYKKREPKNIMLNEEAPLPICTQEPEPNDCEDMDIWIDLDSDIVLSQNTENFKLLDDEVDSFWNNIDPNSLFLELEME